MNTTVYWIRTDNGGGRKRFMEDNSHWVHRPGQWRRRTLIRLCLIGPLKPLSFKREKRP